MNNLQYIVKDNTRAAMHMAVELCELGDFDSVSEAFRWLNQETVGNYTRWHELFGTPERAARTLANVCRFTHGGELCDRCQCYLFDSCDRTLRLGSEQKIYDALLEWLRGDA